MSGKRGRNRCVPTTKLTKDDHSYSQGLSHKLTSTSYNDDESDTELSPFECKDSKKVIHTRDSPAECDFCENCFCFKCSKIATKEAYKRLGSSKDEDGTMWFCYHCRTSFTGVRKMVCRVAKVEQKQADLDEKQEAMGKRIDELENNGIESRIREALMEQKERDIRKLNVMVFGLPESEQETPERRNEEDYDRILDIARVVMELENPRTMFTGRPIRIGLRKPGKSRPLRLTVDSTDSKKKIMEAARLKVKESDDEMTRNVYFHPDLTKKQRDEAFTRRESKRLLKEEEDKKIRELLASQGRREEASGGPDTGAEPFQGSTE